MNLRARTMPLLAGVSLSIWMVGCPSAAAPAKPGTTEANITELTTNILERSQFAHRSLDRTLAAKFLDRYVDSLDPSHSVFLESDMAEFAKYKPTLADKTRKTGDTDVARAVFSRYLQRLAEREHYVRESLDHDAFDFSGHDTYSFDREHADRPADETAAKALWRQRLRAEYLQEKLDDLPASRIVTTLTNRYAEELRTMRSLGTDEVLEIYLEALAHVYDPHSDYLGHEQMESLDIAMNLSLVGIGATLETKDGVCAIHDLVPGGPAARNGVLKPGDRIVAVAQEGQAPVDIVNMPLSHAVDLIRGPKSSTVTLKVIPAGAADGSTPTTVSIVREQVKLADQEAKARIVDTHTSKGAPLRLGVIDLPSFYADTGGPGEAQHTSATKDVARLLEKLKAEHVQGVLVDLRRNGGGSLSEAISLTGLFIRTGPVVQTRDQSGQVELGNDDDPSVAYDGPLVLLTSRFSASATEILAGALQDYGRAVVVGDSSTFGKGTVQSILPLARVMDKMGLPYSYDPGALKVTISKFYRPSGASTQLRGVASDIVLPSTSDFADVSESALKDPLPWDVLPPAPYNRLDRVEPYLSVLRKRSAGRVAQDKDFKSVADDIAEMKKSLINKSVSLNEAERRTEMKTDEARKEAREQADAKDASTRPLTYEITLENVESKGLPTPLTFSQQAAKEMRVDHTPGTRHSLDDDAKKVPVNDVASDEALNILGDYVDLSTSAGPPS